MKAAGLQAIDTVVESSATLIKSKHPSNQKLVDLIASRIKGVICKAFIFPSRTIKLTISSCTKVHSLPIQHRPERPGDSREDYTGEAGAHSHGSRGSGMGRYQFYGIERKHSIRHGRANGLWCN